MEEPVRASVTYEPCRSEVREFARPAVSEDAGLLRVEAAGVCGSDIADHARKAKARILGHENVGVVEELGSLARRRWGVEVGDRVVVEEYLPCGHCDLCHTTDFRFCLESDPTRGGIRYGSTGIDHGHGLWGGFSQLLYLHPRSVLHRAPDGVPAELLTLSLPIGNGFEWACVEGRSGPGAEVVILGPGQQGLACVFAAKLSGAETVVLVGTKRDGHRLQAGKALGADVVLNTDDEDIVGMVFELTGGKGADLVIDTARGDSKTLSAGISMLRQRGSYLFATAPEFVDTVPLFDAQWKTLNLKGVRGHSFSSVEWAISQIAKNQELLRSMATHTFGLKEVDVAIRATAGETEHQSIHCSVIPWQPMGQSH